MTEELLNLIIGILCILESGGDPDAYKADEDAVGILQIRRVMVRDVNEILKSQGLAAMSFDYEDRCSPNASMTMARIYLRHYEKFSDGAAPEQWYVEYCSRIWQGGPDGYREPETIKRGRAAVAMYKAYREWKEQQDAED